MPKYVQKITPSLAVWDGMESVNWMSMAIDCSSTACFTNYASPTHISWRKRLPSPSLKHWHQLELIFMRRSYPGNMLLKRSFPSTDCDTLTTTEEDALLQASKRTAYQCTMIQGSNKLAILLKSLKDALNANPPRGTVEQRWDTLKDTSHSTTLDTFGRKLDKTLSWFEAGVNDINAATKMTLHYCRQAPTS